MTGSELIAMAWESTLSDEKLTRERFPFSNDQIRQAIAELEPFMVRPTVLREAAPWLIQVMTEKP